MCEPSHQRKPGMSRQTQSHAMAYKPLTSPTIKEPLLSAGSLRGSMAIKESSSYLHASDQL
eukprot:scaffold102023_cov17-Prasinocladus_malaysianus.AAC.1